MSAQGGPNVELIQPEPTRRSKIGFALGHVMNDMCASMWFTYLLLYFNKVLQFDNLYSGIIMLIGQLADGFSTVFVGIFSDSGDDLWLCNKVGQRKAWHTIGSFCVVGSFPFIFSSCFGCYQAHQWAQLIYYASFVIIFQFGWAATQISHLAAIPDLAQSQNERTGLTAVRYGMTVTSNILVYLVAWAFFDQNRDVDTITPNDAWAFKSLMLVCIVVGSVASLGFHFNVKFPTVNQFNGGDGSGSTYGSSSAAKSVLKWFKEYQLYQIALIYMSTRLFVNLSQAYIPLYVQVSLQLEAKYVATIPLTMFLAGFVTSFLMKKMNDKFGRKATFIIGSVLGIAGCFWIQFGCDAMDPNVKYYIYCVAVLIGIGGSTMLVTSLALTAEFIGVDTSSSAFIYGLMSLTDKVANGLAVVLIQHNIPSQDDSCPMCKIYFRQVLFYVCGGVALIGALATMSLFKVTVGARRHQEHGQIPVITINEEPDERVPLLH